ncbi:LysM domain [Dillenia turbinata]|uniref:LysM domain n=1 Tax=Dillenia turbinata TaxID=194707 RepID=A0AAN8ZQL7_9MAGN
MGSSPLLLILLLTITLSTTSTVQAFTCSSTNSTCSSLIDYPSPNATTLGKIQSLFGIKNLRTILGANSLPLSTPSSYSINQNETIKILFTCLCTNGSGVSNHVPIYTVQSGDQLDQIATDVFSRLVTYQQIAEYNNISNPDLIQIGQELWIPLPCSCDPVNGSRVVHYGHVVESGSSVEEIAEEYGTTETILLNLNNMSDPSSLQAGQVLDVPLKTCDSKVSNDSLDYPLLVANGAYVFTANSCVKCRCDAANDWTLQCEPSQLNLSHTCPSMQCQASELYIGNTTTSSCNQTICAYAGYNNQTILTTLYSESLSTATCPKSNAPKMGAQGSKWSSILIGLHSMLLCLYLV